ncbi:Gfo/Idh/MocA family oxidoreductase [uncultured Tateyamaria sp.]|uniref:Gfo/Idh/MocA family protein n=1 Tax=uncultured Tateyamaria sp. TaxID=455651 RepID=UPI00261BAF27|nr:Gfo/Idh/MocA family oxidoreductase [uncultured Tateyamaria sp.]
MKDPIRWGILGASNFALNDMAPAIHAAQGAALTALATSSPAKAEGFSAFCPGLRIHDSYDALLADPAIDAVYIPLPNHLHVEWSLKALEAGKHVLCEKPMAMAAAEYEALIAAREASGCFATEAYMIVHHPQWQRARTLYKEGAIGQLIHVEGLFGYDNSSEPGNVRNRPETGGGGIPDIGVYTYGCTRWLTGQEPDEITHADVDFENGVDVLARVSARFPGFSAHWVNSMRMHPVQEMTFVGSDGVIKLTAPFNPARFATARLELQRNVHGGAGGATVTEERFPGVDHYVLQVEAFSAHVRDGAPYPWHLEDARGTQKVIDAVFSKAKTTSG